MSDDGVECDGVECDGVECDGVECDARVAADVVELIAFSGYVRNTECLHTDAPDSDSP
ncbi:MAG: hypothetical protein ACOYN3_06970 [Acidimicrobiia bacterium]